MTSLAYLEVKEQYFKKNWDEIRINFWGDLKNESIRALKKLLESSLAVEVQDLIGSGLWVYNPHRTNYRNGYYYRNLLTSLGYIEDLRVPRIREGGVKFKILSRYKQRSEDIDKMICEMFLNGVSTRKVKDVLKPLFGCDTVSATTVSNITKQLDKMVFKYHNRKLLDEYKYLLLDGIYLNARSPVYKKRRCILACYGIKETGERELVDFSLAKKGESAEAWLKFLNLLYHRGLEGKNTEIIVIDGNSGLHSAIEFVYPYGKIQRCWAHKSRNVAAKCPRNIQAEVMNGVRKIYNADNKNEALQNYKEWQKKWRQIAPKAVECVEEDLEELLNFYDAPEEDWKKVRTTNAIERSFREVRRRTRPMSCFQNRASIERIIFAVFYRLNKNQLFE